MRYALMLILIMSMIAPFTVLANEPNDEVTCCYDLIDNPNSDIAKECSAITNVTAESCGAVIKEWENFINDFTSERAYMEEIIGPCCVEVMRDNQPNEACNILSLDKEICEPIASKFLSQNKGIPLFSNTTKLIIGVLIVVGIVWFIRRKKKRN